MTLITPYLIEERHEFVDSFGNRLVYVHSKNACISQDSCVIHNPSDHHMRTWPLLWRMDRRMFERICTHGVGHPDPDCVKFNKEIGIDGTDLHGCDGCCRTLVHTPEGNLKSAY